MEQEMTMQELMAFIKAAGEDFLITVNLEGDDGNEEEPVQA